MKFEYLGVVYPVEVIRKPGNKNTYLRVSKDLTLKVSTNIFASDKEIERLLKTGEKSIGKLYDKALREKQKESEFYYLGQKYEMVYVQGKNIELGTSRVFVGKDATLEKWYKEEAKKIFQEHLDVCYKNFTRKIPYPKLKVRLMSSRWGVCNYRDVSVTLNLELIKKDIHCLDYVIYHELSHLVEANHSHKFWSVVEENFPDYKIWRRFLKND